MASESDADRLDLSRQLCTQAGMLFEDVSAKVILVGGLERDELGGVIEEALAVTCKAQMLLAAAAALLDR